MSIIPETPYAGDDPERNAEILREIADQLGDLEQPGDPEETGPAIIGLAYRLGRAAGDTDEEIAESLAPKTETESRTITIFRLGERYGMSQALERGRQQYWDGYANGIEDALKSVDASAAADVASVWATALRGPRRPLVARRRGHRTEQVQARRFAVARRVSS